MNEVDFEQGQFGTKATIQAEWHNSLVEVLLKRDICELELNTGKGWRGKSIEFLKEFPELKSLIVLHQSLDAIKPIQYLHKLVHLHLETYSDIPVDFNAFPNLTDCWFEWIKGSDSLFDCTGLTILGINNYKKKSSKPFTKLVNLEKLTLLNSSIEDLDEVFGLTNLTYLRLANLRRITSVNGIQNLRNLKELEINRCKGIDSVSEIFTLNKLKLLFLLDLGDIETIRGIEDLSELQKFVFFGSTDIADGDLSPILKLKNLTKIAFQNRKHYTHRSEDFEKFIPKIS